MQTDFHSTENNKFHVPDAIPLLQATESKRLSHAYTTTNQMTPSPSIYLTSNEAETVNAILGQSSVEQPAPAQSTSYVQVESMPSAGLVRPSAKSLVGSLVGTSSAVGPSQHYAVSCSHQNAGQELCYLCHQRQRRNVPVYLGEEMRRREKEEAQLLAQYQHLKVRFTIFFIYTIFSQMHVLLI